MMAEWLSRVLDLTLFTVGGAGLALWLIAHCPDQASSRRLGYISFGLWAIALLDSMLTHRVVMTTWDTKVPAIIGAAYFVAWRYTQVREGEFNDNVQTAVLTAFEESQTVGDLQAHLQTMLPKTPAMALIEQLVSTGILLVDGSVALGPQTRLYGIDPGAMRVMRAARDRHAAFTLFAPRPRKG